MAKRKAASKRHGKTVASASFGKRKFVCAGKRVRSGKGKGKHPRVFCRVNKKAKK